MQVKPKLAPTRCLRLWFYFMDYSLWIFKLASQYPWIIIILSLSVKLEETLCSAKKFTLKMYRKYRNYIENIRKDNVFQILENIRKLENSIPKTYLEKFN